MRRSERGRLLNDNLLRADLEHLMKLILHTRGGGVKKKPAHVFMRCFTIFQLCGNCGSFGCVSLVSGQQSIIRVQFGCSTLDSSAACTRVSQSHARLQYLDVFLAFSVCGQRTSGSSHCSLVSKEKSATSHSSLRVSSDMCFFHMVTELRTRLGNPRNYKVLGDCCHGQSEVW